MNHPAFDKGRVPRSRRLDNQAGAAPIPRNQDQVDLRIDGRLVHLTNLRKVFWPASGLTKGDLLR